MNRFTSVIDEIEGDFPRDVVLFGLNGSYTRIRRTVETVLKYKKGGELLDIGTGFGILPRILQKFGFTATVQDAWMGNKTREEFESFGFACACGDAALDPLSFKSGSFDVVLLAELIEHIYVSPKLLLGEIFRVLKPGGILVVTTPNFVNLRKRVWMCLGKSPRDSIRTIFDCHPYERHAHEYTLAELTSVLSWSGFAVREKRFVNALAYPTLIKGTDVEVYSDSPARGKHAYPVYDRHFRVNSVGQLLKIPYILATLCVPSFRDGLLAVAQKPEVTPC